MNLVMVSYFRNSLHYLERYFRQMQNLKQLLAHRDCNLSLILGYGDSTDGTTKNAICEGGRGFNIDLFDVSHGGPVYGSIVHPIRFRQLAGIVNRLWREIPESADYVGLVESDLIWSGATLESLLDGIEALRSVYTYGSAPTLLAPMVIAPTGLFYDVWAFRKEGTRFQAEKPYHPQLIQGHRWQKMDSVGSCFMMDGETARSLTWPEEDVVVGFCRKAREVGAKIYLDMDLEVRHP